MRHYILDKDGQPVEETDYVRWMGWMNRASGVYFWQHIFHPSDVRVQTRFTGVDREAIFIPSSRPAIWETRIWGGEFDGRSYDWTGGAVMVRGLHDEVVHNVARDLRLSEWAMKERPARKPVAPPPNIPQRFPRERAIFVLPELEQLTKNND